MRVANIFFVQGDEATDYLNLIDELGSQEALQQFANAHDMGDNYDEGSYLSAGTRDNVLHEGDYVLTWNFDIGYVGLERIIEN